MRPQIVVGDFSGAFAACNNITDELGLGSRGFKDLLGESYGISQQVDFVPFLHRVIIGE